MAGKRGKQTVRDMILSLGVIVAIAAGIWILVPHDDSKDPVARVDYRVELATAQRAAAYPVAAPEGLPKTWKATSVRYRAQDGDSWHLGYLDPHEKYVAVEQSTKDPAEFIENVTQEARSSGAATRINGRDWQPYKGDRYDALVLREGRSTTVVTGSAGLAQLKAFAEALRTPDPAAASASADPSPRSA
ncbi:MULTISPECIES: DUF4245 domain-containing protein [unclassified Streptomyces]|uniref:DUF4245 domain-containing protein n=1 Tax=Streptomyces evansiae TaxID=3075535 RepID=A0ABD5EE87_9ACTN|nr:MULTISPECIES: DUF4245 domain-containing protein [unclassified Streptomyces]MYX24913.1 DUF4245 family protein [Streptomyces sp. SID8380]ASY34808.1 hypothetical protein CAC01_20755 [Streptomyces sp. CLI2509]EGJ77194.1 putative secreted protein [Streptomyces sp. Tu6071]MDT0419381.1 DUF4245 domain-containing protein [Streptomyces sp. DSM 41982]WEH27566.1 DUF4245 domain-containing protein [Streptomyces sp. AM 3-1-1]